MFQNKFTGLSSAYFVNRQPMIALGGARATGVEPEATVRQFKGPALDTSATYLDSKYRNFYTTVGNQHGNLVQR